MTDKKIEEYLERAWNIVEKEGAEPNTLHLGIAIEIAKMIQLEEHRG